MVSLLASCAIDLCLNQTKDYKIGISCFSAKHTALGSKSKHWLAQNQDNVSQVEKHTYTQTVSER